MELQCMLILLLFPFSGFVHFRARPLPALFSMRTGEVNRFVLQKAMLEERIYRNQIQTGGPG